jgi:hypothetical protein
MRKEASTNRHTFVLDYVSERAVSKMSLDNVVTLISVDA